LGKVLKKEKHLLIQQVLFGAPDENKVELFSSASRLTVSSLLLPLYTILK